MSGVGVGWGDGLGGAVVGAGVGVGRRVGLGVRVGWLVGSGVAAGGELRGGWLTGSGWLDVLAADGGADGLTDGLAPSETSVDPEGLAPCVSAGAPVLPSTSWFGVSPAGPMPMPVPSARRQPPMPRAATAATPPTVSATRPAGLRLRSMMAARAGGGPARTGSMAVSMSSAAI
jgi:hypothetical protein